MAQCSIFGSSFKHVLVRHEQAAGRGGYAYSASSQRIGVCLVTSGPGVTNAVTGIATAYMDSIRMVIISGQVPTHAIGQMLSRSATRSASRVPASLANFLVKDVRTWRSPSLGVLHRVHRPFWLGAGRHPEG